MTERSDRGAGRDAGRERPIRFGAVIALGIAAAFLVWLFLRDSGDDGSSSDTTTATTTTPPVVLPATLARLRTLAAATDHPVYWAGPRRGMKYELTRASGGRIYIRYLPRGVAIGDRKGRYLIVATYPLANGFQAVQKAASSSGGHQFAIARDGLAVWNDSSPTNVYFAYPGSSYQVEVYDPDPARARALVRSGRIRPIS